MRGADDREGWFAKEMSRVSWKTGRDLEENSLADTVQCRQVIMGPDPLSIFIQVCDVKNGLISQRKRAKSFLNVKIIHKKEELDWID